MNTKPSIFQSRKFWIATLDALVSIITMIVTAVLADDIQTRALVLGILAALQPIFIALINGIATEDAAKMAADAVVKSAVAAVNVSTTGTIKVTNPE